MFNSLLEKKAQYSHWEYYFVDLIVREALNYLRLHMIDIEITKEFDNCHFNIKNNCLVIGLQCANEFDFNIYIQPFIPIQLAEEADRIRFIVYHELAHYLQAQKHVIWYNKHCKILKDQEDVQPEKYRKYKLEANADKIALILYKKFRKKIK